MPKLQIFEEVKISQEQNGILLTSFYIHQYVSDGGFTYRLALFIFILGYVITSLQST